MLKKFCFSLVAFFFFSMPVYADILITPTHVVFSDKQRFAEVTLANTSNKSKAYEITWQLYEMIEEKGTYKPVEVEPEFDMAKLVHFAPRRVTLSPAGTQRVKLRFSRPSDIPPGDYHVHLKFKAAPVEENLSEQVTEKSLVQVAINVSYTIPIIIRIGESDVQAKIGQISLDRDQNTGELRMALPVERIGGPYSVVGYIRVFHINGGSEQLVGEISNANVFPEVSKRVFNIPLRSEITGGSLRVEIRNNDKVDDVVLAEKVFSLQ